VEDLASMGQGRTGGRERRVSVRSRTGKAGRPPHDGRIAALLALFAGAGSEERVAARHGVKPATIRRWREAALPVVEAALRAETRRPRCRCAGAKGETNGTDARAAREMAMRLCLLERFAAARKPSAADVVQIGRETPLGTAPVSLICETFRVGRSSYYHARSTHHGSAGKGRGKG
jgi:hypothetical protein